MKIFFKKWKKRDSDGRFMYALKKQLISVKKVCTKEASSLNLFSPQKMRMRRSKIIEVLNKKIFKRKDPGNNM